MKGFIVYPDYKVVDDRAYVVLYGRLENGESFCTVNYFKPYFYIKKSDLKKAEKLEDFEVCESGFKNADDEEVVEIVVDVPADVPKVRKSFSENKIKHYEGDIKFPYRFLIDNNINGCVDISGEYIKENNIDRVYNEPELKSCVFKPKLRVLAIDIETDMESKEIYCISMVCDDYKKVFAVSDKKVKNAESFKDEEDLLEAFVVKVNELDPDVITGWNVIDFDLKIIYEHCKKHKIDFRIARDESRIKLTIEENFFRESKANVAGRVVLDALHLLRSSFVKVNDYKLDTVAFELLGEKKAIQFDDKGAEIEEMFKKDIQRLVDYNLKDSELVIRIVEKIGVIDLTVQRSMLTGMPPDRVNASIASFDSLYIKETRKRKLVVPTSDYGIEKTEDTVGGYVRESEPGIYDYMIVLDFKSLYPSIIRTFNIDPLGLVADCKGKNLISVPSGTCFKRELGILPELIEELWEHREVARKEKNELSRYAIKILMNSFYGVMASTSCRFFSTKLANSITETGHFLIKLTSKKIEEMGYRVVYNDTDSCFVVSNATDLKEAEKIGKKLQDDINNFYDSYLKKEFGVKSFLELEFDKCFVKCLMPKLRGSEKGAKKRYAGLMIKDGKERIDITGLEAVRGDWTDLAKKYQNELLDRIFHDKDIINFTRKFITDVNSGKYDDLLVYKKSLRKDLADYAVETPHKKAAKKILAHGGKISSNIIRYVMTTDGPEPVGYVDHKIDYAHYIEKQIKPIAESVLVFFGQDFDDILKGDKQKGLGDY